MIVWRRASGVLLLSLARTAAAVVLLCLPFAVLPVGAGHIALQPPQAAAPHVVVSTGVGSVVVLLPQYVLTARHVVAGTQTAEVRWGTLAWPARVVHSDELMDLAALVLDGALPLPMPLDYIAPCGTSVQIGERVRVRGLFHADTTGTVYGTPVYGERGKHITHTAQVLPGDSGGPLFNAEGWVIGVTIGFNRVPPLGMAVHHETVRQFLGYPCQSSLN